MKKIQKRANFCTVGISTCGSAFLATLSREIQQVHKLRIGLTGGYCQAVLQQFVRNKESIPIAIATPTPGLKQIGVGVIGIAFEKTSLFLLWFAKNYLAVELNHGKVTADDIQLEWVVFAISLGKSRAASDLFTVFHLQRQGLVKNPGRF